MAVFYTNRCHTPFPSFSHLCLKFASDSIDIGYRWMYTVNNVNIYFFSKHGDRVDTKKKLSN